MMELIPTEIKDQWCAFDHGVLNIYEMVEFIKNLDRTEKKPIYNYAQFVLDQHIAGKMNSKSTWTTLRGLFVQAIMMHSYN